MPSGYKPTFRISKGGEDITARFQDRAVSISVELAAGAGAQDSVEISLDDRGWAIATPQVKDRLDVYLGYEGIGVAFMGSFEINKVRFSFPPRTITVCGTTASSLNDLKTQRITNFVDKTVEQILAEAGAVVGMRVNVHPSIADQKIPTFDSNTSFGTLIGRLESQYDAVAKITDGRITLIPRAGGKSVSDLSQKTYVFQDYSFADLEVIKESRGEYAKTIADYYDADGNRHNVESQSKLTERDAESIFKVPHGYKSREEAQAKADSVQAQLDRSGERISATLAEGDPWVRDLQRILVSGIRDGIDGSYVIDMVRHVYEKGSGLRTAFSGQGGVNALAEEFSASTSTGSGSEFLTIGPGEVFGQKLPQGDIQLGIDSFTSTPLLFGSHPPQR